MLQKSPTLTPSLENLSYILRHREWWPDGFEWYFPYSSHCAMGLCERLWGVDVQSIVSPYAWRGEVGAIFCLPSGKGGWLRRLFGGWGINGMSSVTPEMVADHIDRYLAKQPFRNTR
jgi:hypothetical protein